ncbi:hypothetical protein GE061_020014 [Apolygus lucorum]|uniref:Probable arginine--tRNA ligase, mitochondrial n=1 Tax=Apolygus lucorum TaxID=248454 RepID=A0A8S9X9S1_APOLU|nr:hypothetical protein GE061_020014 [Apolygus lucorum]
MGPDYPHKASFVIRTRLSHCLSSTVTAALVQRKTFLLLYNLKLHKRNFADLESFEMTAIKDHLWKRVQEAARISCCSSDSSYFYWLSKDRSLSWRLPLTSWRKEIPGEAMSKLMVMKTDEIVKGVSYSKEDDTLVINLDQDQFISKTVFSPDHRPSTRKSRNLVVEFSSPNIAKPFHMGHLRSTIFGQFAANVLSRSNNVTRLNYLGDWGTQFGFVQKGLQMIQATEQDLLKDPMKVLLEAYTKSYNSPDAIGEARDLFAKLENEDSNYIREWENIKTITLQHLRKIYDDLGIRYDEYSCESDYRASKIQRVIETLIEKQIAYYENGLLVVDAGGNTVPLLRQNKTTLYITRDVAAALDRMLKFKCNSIVYVADKSQTQHFKNLADILEKLGHGGVLEFLPYGRITGMSTRKGTSVLLSDIVEESVLRMAEQQSLSKNTRATDSTTTRVLGLTGLQMYILKHGRMRDFVFDWDHALRGTGDSGVKVQYTHSRLFNLEERFNLDPLPEDVNPSSFKTSLGDPSVLPLVLEIARCDEVFRESAEKMESSLVVNHLFKLSNLTSRSLKHLQVKDQDPSVSQHRLMLFHKARLKIKQCMELLGLTPLNKM